MAEHPARTGGCICGGVRYRITGPIKQIVACHCRECRRQTGHFLASSDVWNEHFELTESRDLGWYRSGPRSRRGFCKTCGCTMFYKVDGGEKISFSAGTLDDGCDGGLHIAAHIFTAEKGGYYDLDGAPAHEDGSDSVPMPARG